MGLEYWDGCEGIRSRDRGPDTTLRATGSHRRILSTEEPSSDLCLEDHVDSCVKTGLLGTDYKIPN